MDALGKLRELEGLIGRTPLLEIRCRLRGRELAVFAKHEAGNFTGSVKDRMALHILRGAYSSGELCTGDTIVEATSGNTGIAFAALGRALGHPVRIYMPDWMSRERTDLMVSLGATVVPVSAAEGGFVGSVRMAAEYAAAHPATYQPRQFHNPVNVLAHQTTTGPEILEQLHAAGTSPTAFVAGVGTGGTVMGVGRFLRQALGERLPVHPLEPSNSPTLRTGHRIGKHRIQGISDEFVPELVRLDELDAIVDARDGDAIRMAQRLARELGLGVGISSGANLLGAIHVAATQGPNSAVVTIFPDCNKKYVTTDLMRKEPANDDDLSNEVELLDFRAIPSPAGADLRPTAIPVGQTT